MPNNRRNLLLLAFLPAILILLAQCSPSYDYVSGEPLSEGQLAFAGNPSGNWELFLLAAGQSSPVQLTRTSVDERSPAISPDGRQIAYSTSDGSLWLMSVDTKESQQLGGPPGHYGYPTWNKDGSSLVYTVYSFNPPSEDAELYTYSLKDRKQTLLLQQTGPQDFPALSPNGDRIAYMSSIATLLPGFGSSVTQQLWVASLQDGRSRQLFWGSFRETRPAWSPDGNSLAFSSDRGGNPDIWMIDSEGREAPIQLTSGPGAETSPAWSPRGNEIAFVSSAAGKSELVVLDMGTKQSRSVLAGSQPLEIRDPAWR
jgi:TolB protein